MAFSFIKKFFPGSESDKADAEGVTAAAEAEAESVQPEVEEEAPSSEADLEGFVLYVTRALVDNPDAVSVETVAQEKGEVIQVTCVKTDIGKIIGKNGKTIAAIRALVSGAGIRLGRHVNVEVMD